MRIPTVKIKHPHPRGYAIINQHDFDPKRHELYDKADADLVRSEPEKPKTEAPALAAEPNVNDDPSEEEMRAAIKAATGKSPHHKLGLDKLRAEYKALQK